MAEMTTRTRAIPLSIAIGVAALLALGACARESDENTNEGTNPSSGEIVVEVRLTDSSIEMPDEIPGGPVLFEVTNSGTEPHGFVIEGVSDSLDSLTTDDLATLRVELDTGTYRVFSEVDGDVDAGLERNLMVTEPERDGA